MRTLGTAQQIYREKELEVVSDAPQYADSLSELSADGIHLVDDLLGVGEKSCYRFQIAIGPDGQTWDAGAYPINDSVGDQRFYTDQSGAIWVSKGALMTPVPLSGGTKGPPAGFRKLGG